MTQITYSMNLSMFLLECLYCSKLSRSTNRILKMNFNFSVFQSISQNPESSLSLLSLLSSLIHYQTLQIPPAKYLLKPSLFLYYHCHYSHLEYNYNLPKILIVSNLSIPLLFPQSGLIFHASGHAWYFPKIYHISRIALRLKQTPWYGCKAMGELP